MRARYPTSASTICSGRRRPAPLEADPERGLGGNGRVQVGVALEEGRSAETRSAREAEHVAGLGSKRSVPLADLHQPARSDVFGSQERVPVDAVGEEPARAWRVMSHWSCTKALKMVLW